VAVDCRTRDKVIHDHFGVNFEIVRVVVENELPKQRAVKTLIDES
jgi:uncharacterized protein with HEPN domain